MNESKQVSDRRRRKPSNRTTVGQSRKARHQVISDMVRHPLEYLRKGRQGGKSCLESILFLQQLRREITADPSYQIANPNPTYARFHRNANGSMEHYLALFSLLRGAGFTQAEVTEAVTEFLPESGVNETRGEAVRAYLGLTREAFKITYFACE